jgi:hypothetical protein
MHKLAYILMILACFLFFLAGIGGLMAADWPHRTRAIAWGLFCWSLSIVLNS